MITVPRHALQAVLSQIEVACRLSPQTEVLLKESRDTLASLLGQAFDQNGSIMQLGLEEEFFVALRDVGVMTIPELQKCDMRFLLRETHLGRRGFKAIERALEKRGLAFDRRT